MLALVVHRSVTVRLVACPVAALAYGVAISNLPTTRAFLAGPCSTLTARFGRLALAVHRSVTTRLVACPVTALAYGGAVSHVVAARTRLPGPCPTLTARFGRVRPLVERAQCGCVVVDRTAR